jgi:hypothetical protein
MYPSPEPLLGIHIILIQDRALIEPWKKFSRKQVKKT